MKDFFDAGFYLNLDKNKDRRIHAEAELKSLDLQNFVKRFPGIEDHIKKQKTGHVCASLGIKAIVSYAKSFNLKNILFFEDDFEFLPEGMTYIESALKTLQTIPDWEIVYFGGIIQSPTVDLVSNNLVKINKMLCVHAIGINSNTFEKWNSYSPTVDLTADEFVRDKFTQKYAVYPLAVTQYNATSQDGNYGNTPDYNRWILDSYKDVKVVGR